MKYREAGNWKVYGIGDQSGGDEVAVLEHQGGGATALVTWGYDYGSGFNAICELDEAQRVELMKLDNVESMRLFLRGHNILPQAF